MIHHRIDLRLNEGVAPRPAKLIGHRLDIGKAAAFWGEKTHGVPRRGMRQHVIHQPHRLHRPQGFIVNADGPRVIDQCGELFHHQHADAHLAKVVGHHQTNRTGANDGDLSGMLHGGLNIGCRCCHSQRPHDSETARQAGNLLIMCKRIFIMG